MEELQQENHQPQLKDLDVDNYIEELKDLKNELQRLDDLEKQKIEQIKYNSQCEKDKLQNRIDYIEENLKNYISDCEDKKETKTLYKKKFISGEVQIKKPQKKINKPNIKPKDAINNEKLKEYTIPITDYKFNWDELKKKLTIDGDKIINTKTGEDYSDIIEIKEEPEQVIIK